MGTARTSSPGAPDGAGVTLVPPWVVSTLQAAEHWDDELVATVSSCARRIGGSVEVDAALVSAAGEGALAQRLTDYDVQCRSFWRDPVGPYLRVRRLLYVAIQVDRRGERSDLTEELAYLRQIAGIGPFLDAWLSGTADDATLGALGTVVRARWERDGDVGQVTLTSDDRGQYPAGLGGLASFGETERAFVIDTNWRSWRDRDVRRIVRIRSYADEVWPEPRSSGEIGDVERDS